MCTGHRCTALRRLAGTVGTVQELGSAIRTTPGAVLVTTDCLGRCELGSLAAIARRHGPTGRTGRTLWLTGIERADRVEGLRHWITDGGPSTLDRPDADLPPSLTPAAVGLGPGARISRSPEPL